MKTAFVVCSRIHSSRVPKKAFIKYAGKTHIEHLVERLCKTEIPVFVAVPDNEVHAYAFLMERFPKRVTVCGGHDDDPLARMNGVAKAHGLETVIRVTHDKIFVDEGMVFQCLGEFRKGDYDYLFSDSFIPGTAFEIIRASALARAASKFKKVEHISYAVKAVTEKTFKAEVTAPLCRPRLLVDYEDDVKLMTILFSQLRSDCTLHDVLTFVWEHPWLMTVNRLPLVTIYTCAYNAEKWIDKCMHSVCGQNRFYECEYILIDDCSTDSTIMKMASFANTFRHHSRWIRLPKNIGLSSASNLALREARGQYIMRMDADDYFADDECLEDSIKFIEANGCDVAYASCYEGVSKAKVQAADANHHVGGAIFKTSALNHLKFTDGLRGYEGLDLWLRAKEQLDCDYMTRPTFVYRQTPGSMSKTNLEERAKLKAEIEGAHGTKV